MAPQEHSAPKFDRRSSAVLAALLAWSAFGLRLWGALGYRVRPGNFRVFLQLLLELNGSFAAALLPPLLSLSAVLLSAWCLGRLLLDPWEDRLPASPGRGFWAVGLGLGLMSHLLLGLGLAGLWFAPVMGLLVALPPLVFLPRLGRGSLPSLLELARTFAAWVRSSSPWEVPGLLLLGAFGLLNLTAALGPEFFYDPLIYHLALPRLYLLQHRIIPTPHMIFSGIPFATEMLYGLALALRGQDLARLLGAGLGVLTAGLAYAWTRKRLGPGAALLAALLFYTSPMTTYASWVSKAELAWCFYVLLALLVLVDASAEGGASREALALAGVFAGFALSAKYNALLSLAALTVPVILGRRGRGWAWAPIGRDLGVFCGAAAVVASPWFLKNLVFYGDPAYPFLHRFLGSGGPSIDLAGFLAEARARDLVWTFTTWEGAKELVTGLWNPREQMANNLGPALLLALPCALLAPRRGALRLLVPTLAALWLSWVLPSRIPRFFLPVLAPLCVLSAGGLFSRGLPRAGLAAALAPLAYAMLLNLSGVVAAWYRQGLWEVPLGVSGAEEYLLRRHPSYSPWGYPGVRFVNESLPGDAVVLFVGEERGFYCERRFITASVYDVNPLVELANASTGGRDLLARLKALGVTHLLLNRSGGRYEKATWGLTPGGRRACAELEAGFARPVFEERSERPGEDSWVRVLELGGAS